MLRPPALSSERTGSAGAGGRRHSRKVTLFPVVVLLAVALSLGLPCASAAQGVDGDLRVGVYTDVSETFVGAGLLVRLHHAKWFFNPNLEYVFVDRGDLITLNADFHYDLASRGATDFWLGAGPALVWLDNGRRDETDLGLNLFAGAGFLRDRALRPFLQAKLVLADESEGVVAFGVRF